jgi:hypothetical protein
MGSGKRFFSEDKESIQMNSDQLPSIKSAINSPLSFMTSLKINVSKPNEVLVKSLSASVFPSLFSESSKNFINNQARKSNLIVQTISHSLVTAYQANKAT